ncbi:hypothetical protein AMK59_6568 [Oryctes borbonicus]|uniref:Uncharacterized protein n=1 Tax=Oryctes borbonicus TaxID=1629725 RepID=A0A0T6AYU0_9SCAR|nr:hypothetical protein AMK59_6568 [Oryctes borbonicus]
MPSIFKRGMIFVTFFGSCFAIALLVASLGTKHWVNASAKRTTNPEESDGKVHFGLFDGKKELNVAYGWRTYDIDVLHLLKYEPDFLNYWLWLGTLACICAGLLFSGLSGVFAAINAATSTSTCLANSKGLYLWNTLALLANAGAAGLWVGQYYLKIQNNVLTSQDLDNMWVSEGMAELGYSFWFVVGAALANFVDIIILVIAHTDSDVDPVVPMLEEKTNGAIMLY